MAGFWKLLEDIFLMMNMMTLGTNHFLNSFAQPYPLLYKLLEMPDGWVGWVGAGVNGKMHDGWVGEWMDNG